MVKSTARVLVVAIALVAGILACQLPGANSPTPTPTASARPNPTATTPAAAIAPPTVDNAATPVAIAVNTDTYEQFQTHEAQTASPTPTGRAGGRPTPVGTPIFQHGLAPHNLQMAFDGKGALHVFGLAPAGNHEVAIFHEQRGADGAWPPPQPVNAHFDVLMLTPVADAKGQMCVVWGGTNQGGADFVDGLFRSCLKSDGTWPAATDPIAQAPASSYSPQVLAVAPGAGDVLDVVYVSSVGDVGILFFSPASLAAAHNALGQTKLSKDVSVHRAEIVVDAKGGLHVIYLETPGGSAFAIQYTFSGDQGKSWSQPQPLYTGSTANPTDVVMQLVADPAGNVHAAWEGDDKIYYRRWTAGTWGESVPISGTDQSQGVRLAVTAAGQARAVWVSTDNNRDALLQFSAQGADGKWSAPKPVSGERAFDLALIVDGQGTSHIVWADQADARYLTVGP